MKIIGENVLVLLTPTISSIMEGTGLVTNGNAMNVNNVVIMEVSDQIAGAEVDFLIKGDRVIVATAALSKNNVINYKGKDFLLVKKAGVRVVEQVVGLTYRKFHFEEGELCVRVLNSQEIAIQAPPNEGINEKGIETFYTPDLLPLLYTDTYFLQSTRVYSPEQLQEIEDKYGKQVGKYIKEELEILEAAKLFRD